MSSLRVFLFLTVAAALHGQAEQNAVPNPGDAINRAVQEIGKNSLGLARRPVWPFSVKPAAPLGARTTTDDPTVAMEQSKCAVPLLEMKVPEGESFAYKQVKPPQDWSDRMPVTHGVRACRN